jgi:uncharacterized membrane protein YqaE (UPF0057 family)
MFTEFLNQSLHACFVQITTTLKLSAKEDLHCSGGLCLKVGFCGKRFVISWLILWFSPGTPASSTTKTGRYDIVEILLKVALKHQKSKSKSTNDLLEIEKEAQ